MHTKYAKKMQNAQKKSVVGVLCGPSILALQKTKFSYINTFNLFNVRHALIFYLLENNHEKHYL